MFYDEDKAIQDCIDDPSLIFELMKEGYMELVDKILTKKYISINVCDEQGNSVMMKLLKYRQYDLVLKHMADKKWEINHQNNDGDTFAHILAMISDVKTMEIMKKLKRKKDFIPNIQNNRGETILDKSIQNCSIYTTIKILEDSRFNNIDLLSFKNLYKAYIQNKEYGIYGKLKNLESIIDNLEVKPLLPRMKDLIRQINDNLEDIKRGLKENNSSYLDEIVTNALREVNA